MSNCWKNGDDVRTRSAPGSHGLLYLSTALPVQAIPHRSKLPVNYFTMGIQQRPWNDYVEGMDRTFDNLTDSIRAGYDKPSPLAAFIGAMFGKFAVGIAIGCGIAVGLAIARAGVGF
jgi:hypothetical protein